MKKNNVFVVPFSLIIGWCILLSSFSNAQSSSDTTYISRNCKVYNIEYISNLQVYTSPNLNKQEYFINTDYFKRYIDSKNQWQAW